jgi:diadenosine tetraphosphate (Ap4A) HIT family hydrolase
MSFVLDPKLAESSTVITRLELCMVRLQHDDRFPWVVLIPERNAVSELYELSPNDSQVLMQEIRVVSAAMNHAFQADKINVAAFGNYVRQLHVHVIARSRKDIAWPESVFGHGKSQPYQSEVLRARCRHISDAIFQFRQRS